MEKNKEKLINQEQTPEQIREILIKARLENLLIDLTILSLTEKTPDLIPDLIIDKIEGDVIYVTYIAEDGKLGELIPLELSRVKGVKIRK